MPTAAPTPCLACHTLGECEHRGQARRIRSSSAWRTTAAQTVETHVAEHGWTCPGWERPPHPVRPGQLTGDHVDSLATTGRDTGRHAVLCITCNASKGANR